jgi:hypothetical protein
MAMRVRTLGVETFHEPFARSVGVPPSGGFCLGADRLKPGHQLLQSLVHGPDAQMPIARVA